VTAVHYFNNPNLLAGETHVGVVVTRRAGTPEVVVERRTVILEEARRPRRSMSDQVLSPEDLHSNRSSGKARVSSSGK
jgi:hypothetical protein